MRLEVFFDYLVQNTFLLQSLYRGECATHREEISLQLRDNILPQASRAEADSHAKMTDPRARVFAHFEIILVASLQANVAELAVAFVHWLL